MCRTLKEAQETDRQAILRWLHLPRTTAIASRPNLRSICRTRSNTSEHLGTDEVKRRHCRVPNRNDPMPHISSHASCRIQKRSIPPIVINWLHDYGSRMFDGRGAVIRYFDRAAKTRLTRLCGHRFVQRNKKYLAVYMVEDAAGHSVITVGYRHRRIRRR